MSVVVTEKAAQEVKRIIEDQKLEEGTVLRIGVAGGGCSGFSYSLGFDRNFDEKADSKYEYHGIPVVVDKKSALYLDGTTVDFMMVSKNVALLSITPTPSSRVAVAARSKLKNKARVS